jgi:hypothetical protein
MQQQEHQEESSSQPETARDCAKDWLRPYLVAGWTIKQFADAHMSVNCREYAAQIGAADGQIIDHRDQPRTVTKQQIAVTRVNATACLAVFDLAEILAELRDEERGYKQQSLAAIFAQQEEEERAAQAHQEPAPRSKRPAVYRSYYGGSCQNPACRADLGYIETYGGRDRLYCDDACRVAAHRIRKSAEKRAAILQYNAELREYWYEHRIEDQLLTMLQDILVKHGKAAARAATDAVLLARKEQIQIMGLANQYRLEPRPPRSTERA